MGLVGRLVWVNNYGKKQCKSLFRRMRAAAARKKAGKKQQRKFQYDPWSYALNFDDGGGRSSLRVEGGGDDGAFEKGGFDFVVLVVQGFPGGTVWVSVYQEEFAALTGDCLCPARRLVDQMRILRSKRSLVAQRRK